MIHNRRTVAATVAAFLLFCLSATLGWVGTASAEAWPARPIKLVVGAPAGGPIDLLARILGPALSERLGQPVVIDNRPGAGGNIGAEYTARSAPDGYTLFVGTSGPMAINSSLYRNMRYDPLKDFSPVMQAASAPFVVVVNASSPWRTLPELLAYAQKNPGKLNHGAVPGNATHLAAELFASSTGVKLVMVPYKGTGPLLNDMFGGQIDMTFASTPGVLQQIKNGKLHALAVTSKERLKELPEIPTLAESGLAGYDASVWYGIVAPARTPTEIIQRLNTELHAILGDSKVRELMAHNDFTPETSSPEQFSAYIKEETDKWGKVVKSSGAVVN